MFDDTIKDELKGRLKEYADTHLERSKRAGSNMYICPKCGSGTGAKGTGALSIKDNMWKCFSCGESGDIFSLIGIIENEPDFQKQLELVGGIFGIDTRPTWTEETPKRAPKTNKEERKVNEQPKETDLTAYIKECQDRLPETDYFIKRGLSEKTLSRFMCGYDPNYEDGRPRAIIPTSSTSLLARATDTDDSSLKCRKKGRVHLFNLDSLYQTERPVIVTEGEIDAMSIIEAGGEALGLGSTSETSLLVDTLKEKPLRAPYIVLGLDGDERGKTAQDKLYTELLEIVGKERVFSCNLYNNKKDANELLTTDPDKLREMIAKCENIPEQLKESEREKKREEIFKHSTLGRFDSFQKDIIDNKDKMWFETGFPLLDSILEGGLTEGLYILGSRTGIGKTSFILQIADHIAKSGGDVLYFSLEMSATELMSKSVSRISYEIAQRENEYSPSSDPRTARDIMDGRRYDPESYPGLPRYNTQTQRRLIEEAMREYYSDYAKDNHITIYEGVRDFGSKQIADITRDYVESTGRRPVVFVDYLQMLAPYNEKYTDKKNVDEDIGELKRISHTYKIPVVTISAFNRAGYEKPKDGDGEKAFRESSAIEYTANVLLGLYFSNTDNIEEEKRKPRKQIDLVNLKGRFESSCNKIHYEFIGANSKWIEEKGRR